MKKWIFVVLALMIGGFCTVSNADEGKKSEDTGVTLEEVVVTATRTEEYIARIPANVTVIDENDIKNSNAKDVPDLLRSQQGVVVRDLLGNGKKTEVDLRGFGETGPYNTLVLVDGRRVNEIDLSGVDWRQIPLEQIERIEIVRGTGSVLYGDNAVGGVINIITKIPPRKFSFSAGATAGSYNHHKEHLFFGGGNQNVAGSLSASYDSTLGYRENNEYRAKDIAGKLVYYPAEYLSLNLSGAYHVDEYGLPGSITEAEVIRDRKSTLNPYDDAETKDGYTTAGLDLDLGRYGEILADYSYRARRNKSDFPDPLYPYKTEGDTDTSAFTPRYTWQGKILRHMNNLVAGLDFYWSEQDLNTYSGFLSPKAVLTGVANIERNSQGAYLNDEVSIFENVILSFGLRRERVRYELNRRDLSAFPLAPLHETVIERQNAYSGGLTYLYGGKSSIFFRANRSFRFPLTDEVVIFDYPAGKIRVNKDLKPQKGKHYELGVRHSFTPHLQGNVTLFRAQIKNEIFFNPATFTNENHPETLHRGVELGTKAELGNYLTLLGNYTYEKATFKKEPFKANTIPAVPRHKANVGIRVHDLMPGIVFSTYYNYVGSSFLISDQANRLEKNHDYFTIDARVSYKGKRVNGFFGIDNLTNTKYSQYAVAGGGGTTRNFYPAPERNWVAGVEISF